MNILFGGQGHSFKNLRQHTQVVHPAESSFGSVENIMLFFSGLKLALNIILKANLRTSY